MANRRKRFEASLTVGLPGLFQETYVSAVTVLPSELMVDTVSISSKLFSSLKSRWQLSRTMDEAGNVDGNKCSVQFDVEISVVDPMIALTLDEILRQVAGRQVEAFSRRCVQVPYSDELVAMINQPQ